MLVDTNAANASGYALGSLGIAALSSIKGALTNGDGEIRRRAYSAITADTQIAAQLIPEILALRHETNDVCAVVILGSLSRLFTETQACLIASTLLTSSRWLVQHQALRALGRAGSNSIGAVPLIVPFLTNAEPRVRKEASNVLNTIDPVSAASHGIDTNQNAGQIRRSRN